MRGWPTYKWTSPARANVPDQIVMIPTERFPGLHGITIYVECKRPGGKLTTGQQREHARLREAGQIVWTVYSFDDVDNFFNTVRDKYL